MQIHKDAAVLGKHTGLKLAVVFGGTDYEKQRQTVADGVDVLIGTPGRLIDYFKQHVFDLRHAQVLVLDEADRMFDLGFIADIRFILRRLPRPEQRQSMLFSATLSQRVLELAYEHMNNPELVRIEPDKVTIDRVRQVIYFPSMEEKMPLLIGLLRETEAHRTMVFVNTRRMAERLEAGAARQRLQCPGALRRRAAEEAAAVPAPVSRGRAGGADRHRRGLARPAHSRCQPRLQFRSAAGCARLRAPHRPHGARRRRGRCHQLRLRGIRGLAAGHRGLHRPQDPGGGGGTRHCWPSSIARTDAPSADPFSAPRRATRGRRRPRRQARRQSRRQAAVAPAARGEPQPAGR